MKSRRMYASLAALAVAGGSLTLAACGSSDSSSDTSGGGGANLAGKIAIDGSSTVAPLTTAAAEAFNGKNPDVNITVGTSSASKAATAAT